MIQPTKTSPATIDSDKRTARHGKYSGQYESLVRQLEHLNNGQVESTKTIGITSCVRGEGVSTVAANLAVSAAEMLGGPVLLVDANTTRPSLHKNLRVQASPGLADVISGGAKLEACLQETKLPNLTILTAGEHRGVTTAFAPEIVKATLAEMKEEYRLVIFDLPEAETNSTCFAWVGDLDGLLLVVEAERVRRPVAVAARKKLSEAGANLLGAVMNNRRDYVPNWLYQRI